MMCETILMELSKTVKRRETKETSLSKGSNDPHHCRGPGAPHGQRLEFYGVEISRHAISERCKKRSKD